jgi:tetratricopeptide (TPR) repeat protein
MRPACFVALLLAAGCKDPDMIAAEARQKTVDQKLAEGRVSLANGDYAGAVDAFKTASVTIPDDPRAYLLLAEAERGAGNEAAAILALKRGQELTTTSSPELKRELVELFRRSGNPAQAVNVLSQLKETHELTDDDVLLLAKLQAQQGQFTVAFETLRTIYLKRPDDPKAKVLEAEVLLLSGDELLAAKLMDRLVGEANLPAARELRARYFLNAGYPESALQDLAGITGESAQSLEVVEIKARALNELKRYDEADRALRGLLQNDPKNADLLAQLAETKLYLGQASEAQALVDQALAAKPRFPRALYVRARALEQQGELKKAADNYEYALRSDPGFGPALSRMWRIYDHRGQRGEAISALERLFFMNQASIEEKVALAEMYAQTRTNVERGKRLMEEALRRDPNNTHYKDVRSLLTHAVSNGPSANPGPSVIIMKGRR